MEVIELLMYGKMNIGDIDQFLQFMISNDFDIIHEIRRFKSLVTNPLAFGNLFMPNLPHLNGHTFRNYVSANYTGIAVHSHWDKGVYKGAVMVKEAMVGFILDQCERLNHIELIALPSQNINQLWDLYEETLEFDQKCPICLSTESFGLQFILLENCRHTVCLSCHLGMARTENGSLIHQRCSICRTESKVFFCKSICEQRLREKYYDNPVYRNNLRLKN